MKAISQKILQQKSISDLVLREESELIWCKKSPAGFFFSIKCALLEMDFYIYYKLKLGIK